MDIFIIGLSIIAVLILLAAYLAFKKTFLFTSGKEQNIYKGLDGELDEIKKKRRDSIERMASIPSEDVYINSRDGLRLRAHYYHIADGAPLAIQFHGYKSMALRDFAGGGYECIRRGYNLLLVDQRAHGESCGKVITFGAKEKHDVISWIDYAIARFGGDVRIMLFGMSMGAGTVLMASELDLPKNVIGIVADCPFSSTRGIIKKVIGDMGLPGGICYPFVKLGALIFGRFNPDGASPVSAVKNTEIPILLIHGDGDTFVPCSMSEEICKSGKTVTFIKIKDATHGLSYVYDYEGYTHALDKFIGDIM